jgi:hypothetical protein
VAFGSIGTLGTGASSSSGTSYSFTTVTNTLASGDFGILVSSMNNTSSADGDNNENNSVSGGTGTWTKLGEYGNCNGAAGSGVVVAVWLFEASATLSTGTTITVGFGAAHVNKTCSFWGFTKAAGTTVAISSEPAPNPITSQVDAANDFGSSTFSGLNSLARLYFRGLAKRANSVTDITPSASFTGITPQRSGNVAAARLVRGEFRINTSTGETSNPTQATSGDTAGLFFALVEKQTGTLSKTLDAFTLSSAGQLPIAGTLSSTLDAFTLSSAGQLPIAGTLAKTLDAFTLSAVSTIAGIIDQGGYAGICTPSGSCAQTVAWYVSPTRGIEATGDGGFVLQDSASGPLGATVHSQAFQLGVDPDFWFSWWIQPASNPATTPRVLWCHEQTASSYVALRQKTDGKLEWVKNVGAGDVAIVTTTTAVSLTDPTHVLINMHSGVTSIGLNGAWEASATDHTDYDQFSAGVGSGSVRFLEAAVSGDNFVGYVDDIKAQTGAYFTVATVGNTYPVPATSP